MINTRHTLKHGPATHVTLYIHIYNKPCTLTLSQTSILKFNIMNLLGDHVCIFLAILLEPDTKN